MCKTDLAFKRQLQKIQIAAAEVEEEEEDLEGPEVVEEEAVVEAINQMLMEPNDQEHRTTTR